MMPRRALVSPSERRKCEIRYVGGAMLTTQTPGLPPMPDAARFLMPLRHVTSPYYRRAQRYASDNRLMSRHATGENGMNGRQANTRLVAALMFTLRVATPYAIPPYATLRRR